MSPQPINPPTALSVTASDAGAARLAVRQLRLRLISDQENAPILSLVADSPMIVGRSSTEADFTAQLRPRNSVNDGRTRRIGRAQTHLRLRLDRLRIDEPEALNPTLVLDTPMRQRAALSLPAQIVIAGEYPLKIRLAPSFYHAPRRIEGWPTADSSFLQGALTVQPGSTASLPCQAALVVSDVTLCLDREGLPRFRPDETTTPIARVHRIGGQFWWQDLLHDEANQSLTWMQPGATLRIGNVDYQIHAHDIQAPDECSADDATMLA
ncbi:hypothetical protein FEM03_09290 [Phragmitibacter flavus]|uniref:FHA domain-containing protein n=1 Tax=Phragmitibacter flavus TaxID=2576071 RepID=A0A5R8KFN1_9BACT|nr:hypothetical protein [Phragmitibacter flavus]TLD71097.1 hypothetical protein FEM03_09290 [Phragmitibacter flavus]